MLTRLRKLMEPLRKHLILRGLIGSIGVGVAGALLPLTLFSGEAPLFSALFVAILVQREAYPAIAIAVIVGLLATMKLSMAPRPAPGPGQTEGKEQEQVSPGPE